MNFLKGGRDYVRLSAAVPCWRAGARHRISYGRARWWARAYMELGATARPTGVAARGGSDDARPPIHVLEGRTAAAGVVTRATRVDLGWRRRTRCSSPRRLGRRRRRGDRAARQRGMAPGDRPAVS